MSFSVGALASCLSTENEEVLRHDLCWVEMAVISVYGRVCASRSNVGTSR